MTSTHERIKSVLLVVLFCGAVFMAYSTWFYDNPIGDGALGSLISGQVSPSGGDYTLQAMESDREMTPVRISVKNSAGRVGAEYSIHAAEALYDSTRALMSEALSVQSGGWFISDEKQWLLALKSHGVLYDYQGLVRVDTVTRELWGGQSEAADIKGRYLLLAADPESGNVIIMMKNSYAGKVYAARAQLKQETVHGVLEEIQGDSCLLACEAEGDYQKLIPETFVREDGAKPNVISGYNAASYFTQEQKESLLKCFGLSPYTVSDYTEPDGTHLYIGENAATVRVEKDGFVIYSDTDAASDVLSGIFVQSAGENPEAAEIFETACYLTSRLAAQVGGEGLLYPMDFTYYDEYNSWVADFGWCINGIPIDRHDTGYAARVVVRDRRVIEASIYMREYQTGDRVAAVVSKKLAAAAVLGQDAPCELELRYTDAGQSELEPAWYRKNK